MTSSSVGYGDFRAGRSGRGVTLVLPEQQAKWWEFVRKKLSEGEELDETEGTALIRKSAFAE